MNHYQLVCEAYDLVCENGLFAGTMASKLTTGEFNNLSPKFKSLYLQRKINNTPNGMIGGSVARKLAAKDFSNLSPDVKNMFSQKRRNMLIGKLPNNIARQINKRNQSLMNAAANKHAQGVLAKANNAFSSQSPLTKMASSFKK